MVIELNNRLLSCLALLVLLFTGCSSSNQAEAVADQDDLQRYAAEHPEAAVVGPVTDP